MMKKRIAALVTAGVLALSMLTGCGSKQESWKVTCRGHRLVSQQW